MSREFELRDQLKSESLGVVDPSAFSFVGSTVFPDRSAKFDLNDFVEVIDAYRATHLPTYGSIIPNSTQVTSVSLADTAKEVTLIDLTGVADTNTVLEVISVALTFPQDYEVTNGRLSIQSGLNIVPVYDIVKIDILSAKPAGLLYGDGLDYSDVVVSPNPIFVSGGEKLLLNTSSTPNATMGISILTRKRSQ